MRALIVAGLLFCVASPTAAAPRAVTVFLERGGQVVDRGGGEVTIPPFGGGELAWAGIVACVQRQFAPFQVEVVTQRPSSTGFITALVGGSASLVGMNDDETTGVSPYNGAVMRGALVHVFSRNGGGERDVAGVCATTAHEVGHALGLDHTNRCGDLMSYEQDRCGPPQFMDADAPCGVDGSRSCGNGERTQNAYRRLGALVGFRDVAPATPAPAPRPPQLDGIEAVDPWNTDATDPTDGMADVDEIDPWSADEGDEGGEGDEADEAEEADSEEDWAGRPGTEAPRGGRPDPWNDGHPFTEDDRGSLPPTEDDDASPQLAPAPGCRTSGHAPREPRSTHRRGGASRWR